MSTPVSPAVSEYFRTIGAKGGAAQNAAKARGARKAWKASVRARKAAKKASTKSVV